jgi:hypothetical protein
MADTFFQMHVHLVFATKNRDALIKKGMVVFHIHIHIG